MIVQDSFVALGCLPFDQCVDFYRALLQRPPTRHWPQKYAEFQLAGLRLALFVPSYGHETEFAGASSGPMSVCLEVADLEAAIAHLMHIGHAPGPVITASHGREVYAYDPAGNRLIIHQG